MVWQAWLFSAVTGLAVLTGIAAAGWTALQLLRRYATRGTDAEPACARCGYLIHPGSRRRCPECGSDLAEVGVVTPSTFPPIYPVLGLWLGAVALGYLATQLGPRLAAATPWGWEFRATHAIETSRRKRQYINSEGVFGVAARGAGRWWGVRLQELDVVYITPMPSDRIVEMDVDPDGKSCVIFTSDRSDDRRRVPLDEQAVWSFVDAAEFRAGDPERLRVGTKLWETIQRFLRRDLPPETTVLPPGRSSATYYTRDPGADRVVIVILWAVSTMALASVLHRLHRRLRRRVAHRAGRILDGLHLAS
jgi:hypothetical protein